MIPSYIVTDLSLLVFKSLWEAKDEAYKLFSRKIRQAIFYASEEYEENFKLRHAFIKHEIIGSPIPLREIYINPVFVDHRNSLKQQRNKSYNFAEIDFISKIRTMVDGPTLVSQYPFLIVKGESGIGKTTFLKSIGLEAFNIGERFIIDDTHMPVFLDIPKINSGKLDFKEMIEKEFEICGFPECEEFTESALKKGKLLILIDNIDYLSTRDQYQILEKLKNFSDTYNSNRFILACQDIKITNILDKYHEIHLIGFGSEQIHLYIQALDKNINTKKVDFSPRSVSILGNKYGFSRYILHNPHYLSIALSLFLEAEKEHFRQTILYEKILNHLVWTNIYKGELESSFEGYGKKNLGSFRLLSDIAYQCLKLGRNVYHISELNDIYRSVLGQDFEEDIPNDINLFTEEKLSSFFSVLNNALCQFSNPLIQKLLVAHYLAFNPESLEGLIEIHLTDPDWKDVFIFFAGIQGADKIISKIKCELNHLIHRNRLSPLFEWVNHYSDRVNVSSEKVIRRIYAFNFLLEILLIYRSDKASQIIISNTLKETKKITSKIQPNTGITFLDPQADLNMKTNRPLDPKLLRSLSLTRLLDISIELAEKAENTGLLSAVEKKTAVSTMLRIQEQLAEKKLSIRQRKICEENIYKIWSRTLKISDDLLNYTDQDFTAIFEYCKGANLIISCLKESFYVSQKMYEGVINSVFENPVYESIYLDSK